MLDRLHAATSAEIAQTDLASASEPDESAAGEFHRNPISVKDNKGRKAIGRAAVAAVLLAHLAIGSAAGYRHSTFSHVDSPQARMCGVTTRVSRQSPVTPTPSGSTVGQVLILTIERVLRTTLDRLDESKSKLGDVDV